MRVAGGIDADMGDAELRPHAVVVIVTRCDLSADEHEGEPLLADLDPRVWARSM